MRFDCIVFTDRFWLFDCESSVELRRLPKMKPVLFKRGPRFLLDVLRAIPTDLRLKLLKSLPFDNTECDLNC
jgi:hypothetical protein